MKKGNVSRFLMAVLLCMFALAGTACNSSGGGVMNNDKPKQYLKPDSTKLKEQLTPEQFRVTQSCGTEQPFNNAFWNNHAAGIYVDVVSGEPLFSSKDKFDSGSGWPSFSSPIGAGHIVTRDDDSHGMLRSEVRSKDGDSHLGHLFDDGPRPTGKRYCINSASLRFIPAEKLWSSGYGRFLPLFAADGIKSDAPKEERAVLAGGCFWGMQDIIRTIPGVITTKVGYTGGDLKNPGYEDLHHEGNGHAEAVEVIFDPKKLSYEELLQTWFFRMHDPTTVNRQGGDFGVQYRSAIFYTVPQQKEIAEKVKRLVDSSGKWRRPVVTEIVAAKEFYPAEDYHQDYLQKNPGGYTCHFLRD